MKKINLIFLFILVFVFFIPQVTYAIEAPTVAEIGSAITFEQNDTISVLSEILDITVKGSEADIVATYTMKNTINEHISTQTMFLSPNIKRSGGTIVVNGKNISYDVKSYSLNYDTEIYTNDWKYAVITSNDSYFNDKFTVDAITFQMELSMLDHLD